MNVSAESLLLYAVTDRSWLDGRSLASQVEAVVEAGATFVQLREKELDLDAFLAEAKEIGTICRRAGVPFVINDSLEVMERSGADGVHIGQSDLPVPEARRRVGPHRILGVSANSVESALAAQRDGADYLGVGAVFSTSTKLDADNLSHDTLRRICTAVSIPVVAIGGIGESNILQLRGTGLDGVAVVSALFASPDIGAATRRMLALAREMKG